MLITNLIQVIDFKKDTSSNTASNNIMEAFGVKVTIRNSKELVEDAFEGDLEKVKGWLEKGYDIESKDAHR